MLSHNDFIVFFVKGTSWKKLSSVWPKGVIKFRKPSSDRIAARGHKGSKGFYSVIWWPGRCGVFLCGSFVKVLHPFVNWLVFGPSWIFWLKLVVYAKHKSRDPIPQLLWNTYSVLVSSFIFKTYRQSQKRVRHYFVHQRFFYSLSKQFKLSSSTVGSRITLSLLEFWNDGTLEAISLKLKPIALASNGWKKITQRKYLLITGNKKRFDFQLFYTGAV